MSWLPVPQHREDILLLALAFSHKEVSVGLQQPLHLHTRDCAMVPCLLIQGLLHLRQEG